MPVGSMVRLTMGTKENLVCKVTETLGELTSLTGTSPTYDVYRADSAETSILTNQNATIATSDEMIALCMIDTTLSAFTDAGEGDYNLFLKFTAAPEIPRLGPFRFRIDD